MHTCYDAPFGGRVRLGRNRGAAITRRVFFLVFIVKDNFVIIDNYHRIDVAFLFLVKFVKYRPLRWFAQLGPGYLVFTAKCIPFRSGNHRALFRRLSWLLVEPIITLHFLSSTGFSVPVQLVHF